LGVGPDDLPAATQVWVRVAAALDETVVVLRTLFHGCPDPDLEQSLMAAERSVGQAVRLIEDLNLQVRRELC
jgi:hypothetical protein